jgi:hypothetical protein
VYAISFLLSIHDNFIITEKIPVSRNFSRKEALPSLESTSFYMLFTS